jgi:hypothetical protein
VLEEMKGERIRFEKHTRPARIIRAIDVTGHCDLFHRPVDSALFFYFAHHGKLHLTWQLRQWQPYARYEEIIDADGYILLSQLLAPFELKFFITAAGFLGIEPTLLREILLTHAPS